MTSKRPLVLAGYGLSAAVRPCIALAGALWHVIGLRALDRVGKGLRSGPRDAILAASVGPDDRAAAFGFHRAMDHAGAVIGPLLALALLSLAGLELRTIFAISAIPGALAVLAIVTLVRERPGEPPPAEAAPLVDRRALAGVLVPLGLFTLGSASDVFLLLKAGEAGAPTEAMPLLWMALHVVKSLASYPGGRLADRYGRRGALGAGWLLFAAVYAALAFTADRTLAIALILASGLRYGLTEGAEKALVAEIVPSARLGTGFGWYHGTLGALVPGERAARSRGDRGAPPRTAPGRASPNMTGATCAHQVGCLRSIQGESCNRSIVCSSWSWSAIRTFATSSSTSSPLHGRVRRGRRPGARTRVRAHARRAHHRDPGTAARRPGPVP
jgi:MFS family permease